MLKQLHYVLYHINKVSNIKKIVMHVAVKIYQISKAVVFLNGKNIENWPATKQSKPFIIKILKKSVYQECYTKKYT